MSEYINLLLTIYDNHPASIIKCAVRVKFDDMPEDCILHWMEAENRKFLRSLLPSGAQHIGPIVAVEQIMDIFVPTN